jgi:hypothetical protein
MATTLDIVLKGNYDLDFQVGILIPASAGA